MRCGLISRGDVGALARIKFGGVINRRGKRIVHRNAIQPAFVHYNKLTFDDPIAE